MKTLITTLPVYNALNKQTYKRCDSTAGHGIVCIITPRHRLPSFQWIDDTDGAASVTKIELIDSSNVATDITAKFTLPAMIPLNHDRFQYKGDALLSLLDTGTYYLKFTTNNAKVYYSEYFKVDCVFGSDTGLPPTATYSEKYLILKFKHSCDFGQILYQHSFEQVLYLESETLEPSFPLEEEGQTNSDGKFVRTFGRQTKRYVARLKEAPAYIVDVLNRARLHDTITLTDLVGETNSVYNLEVEHEWLWEDKYYASVTLTFDYDETVIVYACCTNIS